MGWGRRWGVGSAVGGGVGWGGWVMGDGGGRAEEQMGRVTPGGKV